MTQLAAVAVLTIAYLAVLWLLLRDAARLIDAGRERDGNQ